MCGILFALNGEKTAVGLYPLNKYMQAGCLTGILRGDDSTGLFQVSRAGAISSLKAPVDGYYFLQDKKVQKALTRVEDVQATVLHHRAATHGSVSYDTCHPFQHSGPDGRYVIGVHNGTVHTFHRKEDGKEFEVDSDWLYHRIARDGAEKALGELTGNPSYALVWYEQQAARYYIATNAERPMFWAYLKNKNAMIGASEHGMLWWLANRHGIEIEKVIYPTKDKVWCFDPADLRAVTSTDIIKPEPKPIVRYNQHGGGHWDGAGRFHQDNVTNIDKGKRDAYTPVAGKTVLDNDEWNVMDFWGPTRLEKTKFVHREEATFIMQSHTVASDTGKYHLYGEMMSEASAAVGKAVMLDATSTIIENIEQGCEVYVEVLGVREKCHKKTGAITKAIIVSTPRKIITDSDIAIAPKQLALAPLVKAVGDAVTGSASGPGSLIDLEQLDWESNVGEEQLVGPRRKIISKKDWLFMIKDGCANCAGDLTPDMANVISWTAEKDPVCPECVKLLAKAGG